MAFSKFRARLSGTDIISCSLATHMCQTDRINWFPIRSLRTIKGLCIFYLASAWLNLSDQFYITRFSFFKAAWCLKIQTLEVISPSVEDLKETQRFQIKNCFCYTPNFHSKVTKCIFTTHSTHVLHPNLPISHEVSQTHSHGWKSLHSLTPSAENLSRFNTFCWQTVSFSSLCEFFTGTYFSGEKGRK